MVDNGYTQNMHITKRQEKWEEKWEEKECERSKASYRL